ncbi:hypothetical protein [Nocardioides marmoraquaticus]
MAFDRRHRRGAVLRHVSARLDELHLQDATSGALEAALDCPGVPDTFADDVDLVAAVLLRWNARLSAQLERALASRPADLPAAVAAAWASTARDLPGLRLLVDEQQEAPSSPAMALLVERARDKERARLAWAAGLTAGEGPAAVAAGARLERASRDRVALLAAPAVTVATPAPASHTFVQRLRALVPA